MKALAVLFAVVSTSAFAQVTPPVQLPPQHVLFNGQPTKVLGLDYSGTERPYPGAPQGTQFAQFNLTLQYTPPPGWVLTNKYQWSPLWDGIEGGSQVVGSLLVKGNGTGPSAIGCAYSPGVYRVSCDVQIKDPSIQNSETWVNLTGDCAVVGGPLTFGVEGSNYIYGNDEYGDGDPLTFTVKPQKGVWTNMLVIIPTHDDNILTQPWHLQYFGFDPRQGVPTNSQSPRARATATAFDQPNGTSISWVNSNSSTLALLSGGLATDTHYGGIAIANGTAIITCKFSLTFQGMNGTDTLENWPDDTTSTPISQGSATLRTNVIRAHKPTSSHAQSDKDFKDGLKVQPLPGGGYQVYNNWTWTGRAYELQVKSDSGIRMPGVWVQERFVSDATNNIGLPPSWFTTNTNSGPTWSTIGLEESGHYGNFYFDYLSMFIDPASQDAHPWTFRHEYWAATRSTTTGGIKIGTWDMNFNPGTTPNSIGTVTHTKVN